MRTKLAQALASADAAAGYQERADGLLAIRPGTGALISDLTVYLRPLDALASLVEEMGRLLGGPRPQGRS